MRCIILEDTRILTIDVDKLRRHGDIVFLFPRGAKRAAILNQEPYQRDVLLACESINFDPLTDRVVLAGQSQPLAFALFTMVERYGPLRVLAWDGANQCYCERGLPYALAHVS